MNFSKQLKKYREQYKFSQEELAEKIYVTRQTISKWENDKSYPDIHNLVSLSILFDISLDELVKGDVDTMRQVVAKEKMDTYAKMMALFSLLALIVGVPSVIIFGWWGFVPMTVFLLGSMYYALVIEKFKKQYDIKTYKEIIAFSDGKENLEDLRNLRNRKKDLQHKIMVVVAVGIASGLLALFVGFVTGYLFKMV